MIPNDPIKEIILPGTTQVMRHNTFIKRVHKSGLTGYFFLKKGQKSYTKLVSESQMIQNFSVQKSVQCQSKLCCSLELIPQWNKDFNFQKWVWRFISILFSEIVTCNIICALLLTQSRRFMLVKTATCFQAIFPNKLSQDLKFIP